MPLQNRVTPEGEIVADPARGLFMGNRGILHDGRKRLGVSRWKHKCWIICRISFRGRYRPVMTPNRYTELFFLDEAVAIAAGHRPCFECRRRDYHAWQAAWRAGNGGDSPPRAPAMDAILHGQRVERRTRRQRVWRSPIDTLPDGTFVLHENAPCLLHGSWLWPWSHTKYGRALAIPAAATVTVLTPPAAVGTLRGGYLPALHDSVRNVTR